MENILSKINVKRTEAMKRKSTEELKQIIKNGSLSSAAAQYEMNKRTGVKN